MDERRHGRDNIVDYTISHPTKHAGINQTVPQKSQDQFDHQRPDF